MTDRLGGWVVLISVFAIWLVAITATFMAPSVDIFGYAWLLNSLAYTVTWGSIVQVIGAEYDAAGKAAQLAFCASASRFGASIGNIIFGQLLSAGLGWRQVCMPMLPVQALLLALCIYKWTRARRPPPPRRRRAPRRRPASRRRRSPARSSRSTFG